MAHPEAADVSSVEAADVSSVNNHGSAADPSIDTAISNEEWAKWLSSELRQCPAYEEYSALLDRCCVIAAGWRSRFGSGLSVDACVSVCMDGWVD